MLGTAGEMLGEARGMPRAAGGCSRMGGMLKGGRDARGHGADAGPPGGKVAGGGRGAVGGGG